MSGQKKWDREDASTPKGTCPHPDCGKQRFTSKKGAKAYGRKLHRNGHLDAYECVGGYFHYGNMPGQIKRGIAGRDALTIKRTLPA